MSARDVVIKALQAQHGVDPDYDDGVDADAILSALSAAGLVVVPREPTEAMLQDGLRASQKARHTGISGQTVGAVVRASAFREAAAYRAMIDAAQEATDDRR